MLAGAFRLRWNRRSPLQERRYNRFQVFDVSLSLFKVFDISRPRFERRFGNDGRNRHGNKFLGFVFRLVDSVIGNRYVPAVVEENSYPPPS